jgi:hypothetical protein
VEWCRGLAGCEAGVLQDLCDALFAVEGLAITEENVLEAAVAAVEAALEQLDGCGAAAVGLRLLQSAEAGDQMMAAEQLGALDCTAHDLASEQELQAVPKLLQLLGGREVGASATAASALLAVALRNGQAVGELLSDNGAEQVTGSA